MSAPIHIGCEFCGLASRAAGSIRKRDLPHINTVLRTGRGGEIVIEVLAQLDEHQVRGIALTPTQGLARGMSVQDTGEH